MDNEYLNVKELAEKLGVKPVTIYSTNTKCIVDLIRKEYNYWFNKNKEEKINE